jgi:hypothetical protein
MTPIVSFLVATLSSLFDASDSIVYKRVSEIAYRAEMCRFFLGFIDACNLIIFAIPVLFLIF